MSKLIQLRQRIKAIETIKKITHAMRLIAMSSHSHLKHKQEPISTNMQRLKALLSKKKQKAPGWINPIIHPNKSSGNSSLIILVGSQKGLCGAFNSHLFKIFDTYLSQHASEPMDFIFIGQKAIDFTRDKKMGTVKHSYEKFTIQRLGAISKEITHTIMHAPKPYQSILVFSNTFKSFFVQKPSIATLVPVETKKDSEHDDANDFYWEQKPAQLLDTIVPQYLESQLYFLLFQSLLAEHAARFLSMDTSTRNADKLLTLTKLEFNKQRQAKITKELTELSGSYE